MSELIGVNSQSELRGELDVFLITVGLSEPMTQILDWVIPDFSDIVCGSAMLFQPNSVFHFDDGTRWDFVVSTRRTRGDSIQLALTYSGEHVAICYRQDHTQPIIIAYPSSTQAGRYSLLWPATNKRLEYTGTEAKTTLANSVNEALHRPEPHS